MTHRRCPYCGSSNVRRVAYGLPTMEAFERAELDGIEFGGCVLTDDDPRFRCPECRVEWPTEASRLHDRFATPRLEWPAEIRDVGPTSSLADLVQGSLLWGAVGDALGRPNEGRSRSTVGHPDDPGFVRDYRPWRGWTAGPTGTITDDTQLTMIVAEALLDAGGSIDCDDYCGRLVEWLPGARGAGAATREAVALLGESTPWWQAGARVDSSGNGAAMRSAPVGLAHALDAGTGLLRRLAVGYALPTHAGAVGVAGAVAIAAGVAYVVRSRLAAEQRFEPQRFLEFVAAAIAGIEREPTRERRRESTGPVSLHDRILELGAMLDRDPEEVLAWTWTGAFALESVPAALFCFARSPLDPAEVLLTAANTSHDTDTIASMAGNLVGAMVGASRLHDGHPAWWHDLEYRDELTSLADGLAGIALGRSAPAAEAALRRRDTASAAPRAVRPRRCL